MKSVISVSLSEEALDEAKQAVLERRAESISAFVDTCVLRATSISPELSECFEALIEADSPSVRAALAARAKRLIRGVA